MRTIRKFEREKKRFLPLLLLGDEQEDMIDRYLERGTLYVMEIDRAVAAVAVVTRETPEVYELKNIAVAPKFQRTGLGRAMIAHVWADCGGEGKSLLAGTGRWHFMKTVDLRFRIVWKTFSQSIMITQSWRKV